MSRTRAEGTTAEDDSWGISQRLARMTRVPGTKLVKDEPPAARDQSLETGSRNEPIGRTRDPRTRRVPRGWAGLPDDSRPEGHQPERTTRPTAPALAYVRHWPSRRLCLSCDSCLRE